MVGIRLYLRLIRLAFTRNKDRLVPLTPKQFLLQCLYTPALLLGWAVHSVAFRLDDLFFPGYREITIKQPLFLIGIPRSGTTFLHRLLSEDTDRFTTFQFWELILAPSIIERKCIARLAWLDNALGGFGRRLLVKFDARILRGFREMHHISLFEPEEDEWLFMNTFTSAFLTLAFPFMKEVRPLLFFDEETAPEDKRRIMAYYRACVQRHLYVHGADKRLLSKNPSFSAKVVSLVETFPDAQIACCVRTPYEAVPSLASLMWFVWGQAPGVSPTTPEMARTLLDSVDHFYRHPMLRLESLPEKRQAFIHYEDLTQNPKDTVCALYRRFGMAMSPEFSTVLDARQEASRKYRSSHTYSVEHYGLTNQDILKHFRDIFEHYGFDADLNEAD